MNDHYRRVRLFMQKAGQDTPTGFIIPDQKTRKLRAKLTLEEAIETVRALGFRVLVPYQQFLVPDIEDKYVIPDSETVNNPEDVLDGCADLSVVTMGTLIAFGIKDPEPLLQEVDEANLRKFFEGGYRREDGKWIKPKNWRPPDITKIIEANLNPLDSE